MEMINQNAGASCEKIRTRSVKMEPAWHNSSPKPNLASGEEKNYPPMPRLIPNKEDMESDATVMALYERWCCFWKRNRTPEEMNERFNFFKGRAIGCYERNVSIGRCAFQLFRYSDFTPEESYRPPICAAAGSPPSVEELRRIREIYQAKMGPHKSGTPELIPQKFIGHGKKSIAKKSAGEMKCGPCKKYMSCKLHS